MIVLDASALLVFLFGEPGHAEVARVIERSCMSTVNLAEVVGKFVERGVDARLVLGRLRSTTIEFVPFDADQAARSAAMLPLARPRGLSLADRACLALAASRGVPVITADRAWQDLDVGVDVRVVR